MVFLKLLTKVITVIFLVIVAVLLIVPAFGAGNRWGFLYFPIVVYLVVLICNPKALRATKQKFKVVYRMGIVGLIIVVVVIMLFSGLMLNASNRQTDTNANTVVVLGCMVNGDRPSPMLIRRLDTAVAYLAKFPNCNVIVTGGKSSEKNLAEGEVMQRYLVDNGVDKAKIFIDDEAISTEQNMKYSAQIIEQNKLDKNIIVVTDNYHQFRAGLFAKKYELTATPLGCSTQPIYAVGSFAREIFAILRAVTFSS